MTHFSGVSKKPRVSSVASLFAVFAASSSAVSCPRLESAVAFWCPLRQYAPMLQHGPLARTMVIVWNRVRWLLKEEKAYA
jgi:hypothetical protein